MHNLISTVQSAKVCKQSALIAIYLIVDFSYIPFLAFSTSAQFYQMLSSEAVTVLYRPFDSIASKQF